METHQPSKAEYMKAFKRYEPVVVDSTAMMQFKTCPLSYFYRIVLGFTAKDTPQYFAFGAAYHKFREILEQEITRINTDGKRVTEQEAFLTALGVAVTYYSKKPQPPLGDKWEFLTIDRLKQSCAKAFQHWLNERLSGKIKVIAFEQPFTLQLDDGTWVAGRADQIVDWSGETWGRDFKTTSKAGPFYSRSLEPNDQFTRYTWGESKLSGRQVKGQIVEVLYNSKKEGPEILTYTTQRSPNQLKHWEKGHRWWMDVIEKSRNEDFYPENEKSCNYCPYHSVCKAPSESGKMSQLKSYFKVEPWDCTNVPD